MNAYLLCEKSDDAPTTHRGATIILPAVLIAVRDVTSYYYWDVKIFALSIIALIQVQNFQYS